MPADFIERLALLLRLDDDLVIQVSDVHDHLAIRISVELDLP